MPLINSIVNWLNIKRSYQIDLFKKYPYNVQEEVLFKLIERAEKTHWGKKHNFESIKKIKDFQKENPLQTYDDLKPYVERLRNGETGLLWPNKINWFAKSSGTTSDKSKFIPVSKEALEECHYRGGKDTIVLYTQNYPQSGMLKGKGLTLGGSHKIDNYNNKTYYGDLSAILIDNLPFWADFIRTPSQEISLLEKWEEKLEKITKATIKENVTSISGVPSWVLVLLNYIFNYTGEKDIYKIWPNIELFIHGGISFTPYKEQFKHIFTSSSMNYLETYNASEGFFAIQNEPQKDDMLLMLDYGIFYEFIPMDEFYSKNPTALSIDKVEKNVNYAIVITTNSGLWRYIIGDTITFTSLFPHKIKITGRTKHFINAFGEELIIDNADRAIRIACEKTNSEITDYTAAPVFMAEGKQGAHEWLIEFYKMPGNIDYFAEVLDNALKSLNSDYEAKRYKGITLDVPIIRPLKKGTFNKWLSKKGKLGGQNKVPRLANDRKYIDELLKI